MSRSGSWILHSCLYVCEFFNYCMSREAGSVFLYYNIYPRFTALPLYDYNPMRRYMQPVREHDGYLRHVHCGTKQYITPLTPPVDCSQTPQNSGAGQRLRRILGIT